MTTSTHVCEVSPTNCAGCVVQEAEQSVFLAELGAQPGHNKNKNDNNDNNNIRNTNLNEHLELHTGKQAGATSLPHPTAPAASCKKPNRASPARTS